MARLKLILPALALLLSGCSRILVPEKIENRIGELVTRSVLAQMPAHTDPAWQQYIEDMGRKIAAVSERPAYHYRYYIVESSTVNAFAVPDGSIFVTTGLLKLIGQDQLALAGVLAHETGHIARRHGAETLQSQLGYGLLSTIIFGFGDSAAKQAGNMTSQIMGLGYGREMELEADVCAVRYLARLGYPPDSSLKFLRSILPLEGDQHDITIEKYLRSHPPTTERIQYVEAYIRRYLVKP
ncbi:MAG: M48 family metalloprotease [Elusimicrobia bacterium]|nr:M48 family metalloprotease [Elusimicrobiota bacterium]